MYFNVLTFGFSVDSHKVVYIECDPCSNEGTKGKATHICKTCEDPEPLCETCAKQHTRQKAFRDHELSGIICEIPKHPSNKGYKMLWKFVILKKGQYTSNTIIFYVYLFLLVILKKKNKDFKKKKKSLNVYKKNHEYLLHFKYFYLYFCRKVQAQNERVN